MNKRKIIYWTATGIITAMMLFSAFGYFTDPEIKTAFMHLYFHGYFRIELGILKVLGALVLIPPMFSDKVKSFAYLGFGLMFISAFITHTASEGPMSVAVIPFIFLVILAVSYYYQVRFKLKN